MGKGTDCSLIHVFRGICGERESLGGVEEGSRFTQTSQTNKANLFEGFYKFYLFFGFARTIIPRRYLFYLLAKTYLYAPPRPLFCSTYSRNHQRHLFMAAALSNKDRKVCPCLPKLSRHILGSSFDALPLVLTRMLLLFF